ncbi:transposase [Streptomyces griseorubiginosus]|uniref:transposase n=1 Tax=Streptomyces griseorubiginosus TaxID=67304 RepID=UPI0036ED2622
MEFVDRLSQVNKSVLRTTAAGLLPPGAAQDPSSKIIQVGDHGLVVRRHELTHEERELLAPLRARAATGRPRVEDRQVINGTVHKICTGISWRDLPERYGTGAREPRPRTLPAAGSGGPRPRYGLG